MLFRQVLHEDLGCASYMVGDGETGQVAVVDPQWNVEPYLDLARLHGVSIEHVLETHNHADHVSGHGRLVEATGATIHVSALADAQYEHDPITDGWTLDLGHVRIEALPTPGHRPEHTAFLLRDLSRGEEPWAVLTGDSLFVGDVARPDLAIEAQEGAAGIFRSLHDGLLALPDEVEVWPGHLGGSLCGSAGIDQKTSSTIGYERKNNLGLRYEDEASFIEAQVESLGSKPPNLERIVALNQGPLRGPLEPPRGLAPREVETAVGGGATLIDARPTAEFSEAHIPGALSASAQETGFATRAARVIAPDEELIVVAADDARSVAASHLLAAVGLRVDAYLEGGMDSWRGDDRAVEATEAIDVEGLVGLVDSDAPPTILDVRDADEFTEQRIPGSINVPYGDLGERVREVPTSGRVAVVCSAGRRSPLAASMLQRAGVEGVAYVTGGGVTDWAESGRPVEAG